MNYEEEYHTIRNKMFEIKLKLTKLEERAHPQLYKEEIKKLNTEYEQLKSEMYKCKYKHYEEKKEGR